METGYVYILINSSMPGLVKIGHAMQLPEGQAKELLQPTGVPTPFQVAWYKKTPYHIQAGHLLHNFIARFRSDRGREFFAIPLDQAINTASAIIKELHVGAPSATDNSHNSTNAPQASKSAEVSPASVFKALSGAPAQWTRIGKYFF
jgi:hypothetical protein